MTTFRTKVNSPKGSSTLDATIDDDDLEFDCAAGEGDNFPGAVPFTVSINDEIILCDSRAVDTFTVNAAGRGYDSSTATAHTAGDAIYQNQIIADFTDLETAVGTLEDHFPTAYSMDVGDAGGFSGIKFNVATTEIEFYIDAVLVGTIDATGAYTDEVA